MLRVAARAGLKLASARIGPLLVLSAWLTMCAWPSGGTSSSAPSPAPAPSAAFLFEHLGMERGLSQSTVRCIFQDHLGFLWFGTQDGLNKYDGYSFTIYRHRAGDARSLPENSVTAIAETRDGVLWVGTVGGGVAAFHRDTEEFEAYRHDPAQATSIADNHISALVVDRAGALWIGTGLSGIDQWDQSQRRFLHHRHDAANPASLASNRIAALVEGRAGTLWVGFSDLGVDRLEARTGESVHYRPSSARDLSADAVTCLYWQPSQEALWVGTHAGLNRLDARTGVMTQWPQQQSGQAGGLADRVVNAILESARGGFWIATANGLDRMEPGGAIEHFRTDPLDPLSLSSNATLSLLEDQSGLLWIGTDNRGVSKCRRTRFVTYRKFAGGLPDQKMDGLRAITKDAGGVVWLGTVGAGLVRLDRARGQITHYQNDPRNPHSLAANSVTALLSESSPDSSVLWVGTSIGLAQLDVRTGLFTQIPRDAPDQSGTAGYVVWVIHEDRQGALWVGTANGLALLDRRTGSLHRVQHERGARPQEAPDNIRAMAEDRDGRRLWLGTRSAGLALFDPQTGDCRHFVHDLNNPQSISSNAVYAVHVSRSTGDVWVGTTAGIDLLDRGQGRFQHFGEMQGLANETIYAILEDHAGNLWISTDKGISRFNPKMRTFTNYDVSDGLQGNEFHGGSAFQSADGELLFGGINGLNAFDPKSVEDRTFQPPVVFTAARKLDRVVTGIDQRPQVTLQATDPVFSAEFAALDYAAPEKNQYAYMLEGFDRGWTQSGTRRFASYTNLDGGTYRLRVRGTNGDGRWSGHEAALEIEVIPPVWKTWWFRAGAVVMVLGIFWLIYQRRSASLTRARVAQEEFSRRLIESQETERKRIASELHDSLGQNLIVIKNHALLGMTAASTTPESAVQRLEAISAMASEAIDEVREISRNLRPYQLDRFGLTRSLAALVDRAAGIEFSSKIDSVDGLLSKEMEINLYRIVQESVTNVLKHAQATRASLTVLREAQRILVTVEDNGRGIGAEMKSDGGRGFGLVGMAERARILGARHEIRSAPGQGTTVTVEIPLG